MGNEEEAGAAHTARRGWDESFKEMHERGEDRLLDEPVATTWDEEEWEW